MSLTDYIIAKQLGMSPAKVASRPVRKLRQTCANCGKPIGYSAAGSVTHALTGRAECR